MVGQHLQVEGTKIYFEVKGTGPYIVFIPGANGDSKVYKCIRNCLTNYFTVVLYDRRGYSNSSFTASQDYHKSVNEDVDDIYNLMKSLTNEKFIIFSNSTGGFISMSYLIKYPETVQKVFSHEPMVDLYSLPNSKDIRKKHEEVYDLYQDSGLAAALSSLGKYSFNELDYKISDRTLTNEMLSNRKIYFKHEFLQYIFAKVDMNMVAIHKDLLIFLRGEENVGYLSSKPCVIIAKSLDKEVLTFPGGHIGFFTEYEKFSIEFIKLCKEQSLIMDHSKL